MDIVLDKTNALFTHNLLCTSSEENRYVRKEKNKHKYISIGFVHFLFALHYSNSRTCVQGIVAANSRSLKNARPDEKSKLLQEIYMYIYIYI